ncbi:DUF1840 domain-containing protein [Paraglaciecola sp. L3A3]|uniref:DUF1840 domain-containing protein n=1 Tax=Paraglaciecola sp. L3A3 TaxID=2686358 RepID=UPI00131B316B|nr:DUF1840 domain-containing protein [Paraglaciecola sp. L3A3]
MLVIFSSPASANITMFGDVAVQLLKMLGHSGTVPSAIRAEDIPAALASLEAALGVAQQQPEADESTDDNEDAPLVSLHKRALPLIDMLKAAAKDENSVQWANQ